MSDTPTPDPRALIAEAIKLTEGVPASDGSFGVAPGTWTVGTAGDEGVIRTDDHSIVLVAACDQRYAPFIAASRSLVPSLADALEAALDENKRLIDLIHLLRSVKRRD